MQCLKIYCICVFVVIPVLKPHTYKLYILRHCTDIVYINDSTLPNMKYNVT